MALKINTRKVLSALVLDKRYQPVRLKFFVGQFPIHIGMSSTINVKRRRSAVGLTLIRKVKSVPILASQYSLVFKTAD